MGSRHHPADAGAVPAVRQRRCKGKREILIAVLSRSDHYVPGAQIGRRDLPNTWRDFAATVERSTWRQAGDLGELGPYLRAVRIRSRKGRLEQDRRIFRSLAR